MITRTRLGIAILLLTVAFIVPAKDIFSIEKPAVNAGNKTTAPINVLFYGLDKKIGIKGKLLGSVKLENGSLVIDVSDPKLEKLLKSDIIGKSGRAKQKTMPNGKKILIGGLQVYKSGTKEHLESIVKNARAYGYYAEKQK